MLQIRETKLGLLPVRSSRFRFSFHGGHLPMSRVGDRMNCRCPQWLDIGGARRYQRCVRPTGLRRYCRMLRCCIDVDGEKLEQVVLALLHLNSFKEGYGRRAWKNLPWVILDSLHEKGYTWSLSTPRCRCRGFSHLPRGMRALRPLRQPRR